ncbi:glycosyltransferase family 1 protein [Herbiconiux sp.]|uniref:glycosyltransferase family 4 protein n=1 Tax=Herbiconiux sp. TaxID=1871186 RepID=UPI0025BE58F4|nr:glycosyltransferase family 1 protein [Herbiconiux sp.]
MSYLAIAVINGAVPNPRRVEALTRRWRLEGLAVLLKTECDRANRNRLIVKKNSSPVRVSGGVIVDVTDTGRSTFTTGIQRVARETLTRWVGLHEVQCVSWTQDGRSLHRVTPLEYERATLHPAPESLSGEPPVVIPFRATFVLPEIAVDHERALRIRTIAEFSGSRTVAVGFDTIPVTSAETAGAGMPGAFSKYLATLARFSSVATISSAAQIEYVGWRSMLPSTGLVGPEIVQVDLPAGIGEVSVETVERVRHDLELDDVNVVLAVGSHEPRKNHLRLLVAAELRWRQGDQFALVMVGGNSWDTSRFDAMVERLRAAGRPIILLSNASDEVVWSLYRIARFSVFCSLNEGFGLPIVESLASGTPVVTSDFGSMRELGEGYGAVLADPHDAYSMARAMGELLSGDEVLERMRREAENLPLRSWDTYADRLWLLVDPTTRD